MPLEMTLISIETLLLLGSRPFLSLACVLGIVIPWTVVLTLYRLYFHSLSAFPGPALAGATGWYETYYEVYQRGKMVEKLEALHKRYGLWFSRTLYGYLLAFFQVQSFVWDLIR